MHALLNNRLRGLVAVRNNGPEMAGLLREVQSSFEGFKTRYDGRVDKIEAAIDELSAARAADRLGGAGGDLASPKARRKAVHNLGRFGRSGRAEDLLDGLQVNASMSSDNDPSGGYTVPEELSDELMTIQRNDSAMRRLARVVKTNSATFKQPFAINGVASGWVGERQQRPETDGNTIAALEFPAMELYANPAITQGLLDDSAYDLGAFIASEISDAFTEQEGTAFISGNGVGKPRGFLSYDTVANASWAWGKLGFIITGAAADFATEDPGDALIDLVYSLPVKYRRNGTWLMNSATAAKVRKFKDDQDRYLWVDGLAAGQPDRLLGYPVEIDEAMSDTGASAYPVAFGDFRRGYLITDRVGMRILRDPLTNKPYVHFYTTKRVGGGMLDFKAIKLLKCAAA